MSSHYHGALTPVENLDSHKRVSFSVVGLGRIDGAGQIMGAVGLSSSLIPHWKQWNKKFSDSSRYATRRGSIVSVTATVHVTRSQSYILVFRIDWFYCK